MGKRKSCFVFSMKNVVSLKLMTNSKKRANETQQRDLVFLRLPRVFYSNNEKQSWLLVMETENEYARGKHLWLKLPSLTGLIIESGTELCTFKGTDRIM